MDSERLLGKSKPIDFFTQTILIVAAVVFVVLLGFKIFNWQYMTVCVNGASMSPTLSDGDYLYAARHDEPERGDIVVIDRGGEEKYIIKRVIALGGDELFIDRGTVYIKYSGEENFIALEEDYVLEENNDPDISYNSMCSYEEPYVVEEDKIFVLGDNRGNVHAVSKDSRYYGAFDCDKIAGVVTEWSLENKSWVTSLFNFI